MTISATIKGTVIAASLLPVFDVPLTQMSITPESDERKEDFLMVLRFIQMFLLNVLNGMVTTTSTRALSTRRQPGCTAAAA